MEVEIENVVTTVRAVDSESLLSPQVLEAIVRVVVEAVEAREQYAKRVRAEQRITAGVASELEEEL